MNGLKRDLLPSFEQNSRLMESTGTFSPSRFNNRNKKMVAPIPMHKHSSAPYNQTTPLNEYNFNSLKKRNDSTTKLISVTKNVSLDGRQPTTKADIQTEVEFQSILRIRPFNLEERGEKNLFDIPMDSDQSIRLHNAKDRPIHSTHGTRQKELQMVGPIEYHFDGILDHLSTQADTYNLVCGDGMALDVVAPLFNYDSDSVAKQHVIVSIGVSNSGKTFTMFGDSDHDEEGIVQRLFDDIFLTGTALQKKKSRHQREHASSAPKFALQLSMVHLHKDHIYDLLSSLDGKDSLSKINKSQKRKSSVLQRAALFESCSQQQSESQLKELRIQTDRDTLDFTLNSTFITCHSPSDAREVLEVGLKNTTTASTKLNKQSSRGHTIITARPILERHSSENDIIGDSITLLDLAGIERTKSSAVSGKAMRESVSINSSISAMLQCLRAINHVHGKKTSSTCHDSHDTENISPVQENHTSKQLSSRSSKLIPYRQNKLTMLLQPLFSGNSNSRSNVIKVKSTVKMLVSVYPGMKDYNEKKVLLGEIDALRGLKTQVTLTRKLEYQHSDTTLGSDEYCTTTRKSLSMNDTDINNNNTDVVHAIPKMSTSSPLKRLVNKVKTSSSKKRKAEVAELLERIQTLEMDNNRLLESYKQVKQTCKELKQENGNLKLELEKSKSDLNRRQQMRAEKDDVTSHVQVIEKSFYQSRDIRRKQQSLLSSPIKNHMKAVEAHSAVFYGTIGTMIAKPPFKLVIPSQTMNKSSKRLTEKGIHSDDVSEKSSYSA